MDTYKFPLSGILCRAGLALAASALILLVLLIIYSEIKKPAGADYLYPIEIPGKSLQAVVGSAEPRGEELAIKAYDSIEGELTAVAVWRGRFKAADYPLLTYQFHAAFPGQKLRLIWRAMETPRVLFNADLNGVDNGPFTMELARQANWQGTVVEMGVYAIADSADQALSISYLSLQPLGWRGLLDSYWSDWSSFRGWTARTINFLYGTVNPNAVSPVMVAAAWSTLAVILLWIAGISVGGMPAAALAAVLLPWIALDVLWQSELMSQLSQTRHQFAGKTVHEKHLADIDRDIYRYVMRLKHGVLPADNTRIAILHNSQTHNFKRLKAQYYLLPNNVYNLGRMPPETGLDHIDYILVLGEVPGLEFHAGAGNLVWQHGNKSLPVELLDNDPLGRLFRVTPRHIARTGHHD